MSQNPQGETQCLNFYINSEVLAKIAANSVLRQELQVPFFPENYRERFLKLLLPF